MKKNITTKKYYEKRKLARIHCGLPEHLNSALTSLEKRFSKVAIVGAALEERYGGEKRKYENVMFTIPCGSGSFHGYVDKSIGKKIDKEHSETGMKLEAILVDALEKHLNYKPNNN